MEKINFSYCFIMVYFIFCSRPLTGAAFLNVLFKKSHCGLLLKSFDLKYKYIF